MPDDPSDPQWEDLFAPRKPPTTPVRRSGSVQRLAGRRAEETALLRRVPVDPAAPETSPPAPGPMRRLTRPRTDAAPGPEHAADTEARSGPDPDPVAAPDRSLGRRASRRALREAERTDEAPPPPTLAARLLLPASAAGLMAWAGTSLLDVGSAIVAALAALSPLVSVAAIPVIALSVRRRRVVASALAVAAAVVPWLLVSGYLLAGPGVPPTRDSVPLRVLTINAAMGRADATQITALARANAVDLLVVTELTGTLAHELTAAGIDTVASPRWVDVSAAPRGGIGVWSRHPVEGIQPVAGTRWPAGRGVVRTPGGPVNIVVTHVGAPRFGQAGRWSADLNSVALASQQQAEPRLVVGDFAATPWNANFRRLSRAGLHDAADVMGGGLRPTWPAWSPVPAASLDHVLVGGDVGVRSVASERLSGTDHLALIVELALPRAG